MISKIGRLTLLIGSSCIGLAISSCIVQVWEAGYHASALMILGVVTVMLGAAIMKAAE